MLPARKTRHTTNSNHRYHKWKNLIKGLTLTSANQLWVSDITYIPLANGEVCYLHLITDAYSHKIVGWVLADTLRVSATINALQQAIEQAVEMTGDENLTGLIHHSDRGVQYCCDPYVALLQKHGIAISMTEDYKPTDNAVAERINGIIKAESSHPRGRFNDIGHARNVIARYIHFYNHRRPHMSIGYKIPAVAHLEKGIQKKMWKKKNILPQVAIKEGCNIFAKPDSKSGRRRRTAHLTKTECLFRGTQSCRTSKHGLCKCSRMTVNRIRTTHFAVSTISAGLGKK